jgi:heptosyltransferase-2
MEIDKDMIRKILVVQVGGIGDVILTTPVLSILKKHFPGAEVHFCTSALLKELISRLPKVDRVIIFPKPASKIFDVLVFYRILFQGHYDLIIDYQCTPGTALPIWFSRAPLRLGWKMKRRQWAYNLYSEANRLQKYVPIQKCLALREIGIDEVNQKLEISLEDEWRAEVDKYFIAEKVDRDKLLVNMTPKGQVQTREWPPSRFVQLADLLVKKHSATVFFSGNPVDREYLKQLAAKSPSEIKVIPPWPLHLFAAYLSQVDLHFSYDNGPKHLAIAVKTPTLSLFATDPPLLWNPENNPNQAFLLAEVPCRFCRLIECPLMVCMKSIEPEKIFHQIENIPALQKKLVYKK